MAFSTTNVVTGRDFKVYTVAYDSTNTIPADTVVYPTSWGTPSGQTDPWTDIGYTDGGLQFNVEVQRGEIRVDQEVDPILRPATGRNMTLATNMAEFTAANIKAGAGQGTITTVAAGSGTRGHDDLDISGTITDNYRAIGFDIKSAGDNESIRIIGWKTLPQGGMTGRVQPTDKLVVALNAFCLPDSSTSPARVIKFRDIIPALP